MLKMTLTNSTRIGISFHHDRDENVTTCKLFFLNEDGSIDQIADSCRGYSYCHASDQFNKETGRKVSLERALDDGRFTREERREVWQNYFRR